MGNAKSANTAPERSSVSSFFGATRNGRLALPSWPFVANPNFETSRPGSLVARRDVSAASLAGLVNLEGAEPTCTRVAVVVGVREWCSHSGAMLARSHESSLAGRPAPKVPVLPAGGCN